MPGKIGKTGETEIFNHREHKVVLWFVNGFFIKVIHRSFRPVFAS